jgi:hypothetical protein
VNKSPAQRRRDFLINEIYVGSVVFVTTDIDSEFDDAYNMKPITAEGLDYLGQDHRDRSYSISSD